MPVIRFKRGNIDIHTGNDFVPGFLSRLTRSETSMQFPAV